MKFQLSKDMVLLAVSKAISPDSAYINDEVSKMHRAHVGAGGTGHAPRVGLVLARLKALAADGLLEKSGFPNGYYGYRWELTAAGRSALTKEKQDG